MSHAFADVACAVAVVAAVGAGTVLVLPRAKPEPAAETIVLDVETPPAVRVEPMRVKSDAERVDELQRRLSEILAEQKSLASDLRTSVAAHKDRRKRAR